MTHENKIKYLYSFTAPVSIKFLLNQLKSQLVFPFWHVVSDEELPHISCLYKAQTLKEFNASLEVLLKDFIPISMESVVNQTLNPKKKYMCLSFDDGLVQMHDLVAPILKAKGIPAAFFINPPFVGDAQYFERYQASAILHHLMKSQKISKTKQIEILNDDFVDKNDSIWANYGLDYSEVMKKQRIYMNLDEIKSLHNDGFHIGAHSMTHVDFSLINLDEKIQEVKSSVEWVAKNIQPQIKSFAFPFSDDGNTEAEIAQIYEVCKLDISFGTSGHGKMNNLPHYQRIPMEHSRVYPARKILKSELFSAYLKQNIRM